MGPALALCPLRHSHRAHLLKRAAQFVRHCGRQLRAVLRLLLRQRLYGFAVAPQRRDQRITGAFNSRYSCGLFGDEAFDAPLILKRLR